MSEEYYTLSTTTTEVFNEVHHELTTGVLISRNVVCEDIMDHSPTRAEFLLTDEEAATVGEDARVAFINLTPARYPDIYNANEDDLRMDVQGTDYNRYGQTVKNWQFWANSNSILGSFTEDTAADAGRASNQLLRCKQKRNPWISGGLGSSNYIDADPVQQGAGENVDIICADNGTWIGHVEFINPNRVTFNAGAALSPQDYTGGNVLPGNGYCDVLDVVLDGPYYIDPDWFTAGRLDPEYNNGPIIDVVGDGSDFFKREVTVNGVRIVGAGSVGGQVAVPDAWLEKVGRMFELFTDPTGSGINEAAQRTVIKTLSGDAGTYHAAQGPTLQRVARGAGGDYTTNFLTDDGITFWNLSPLFDSHVANDMVWYLNSTGDGYGDGDNDAQEVIEHVFHTLHMHGLDAVSLKLYSYISADWASGPLYAAMEEAYDAGMWDSSGYGGNTWKTDGDAFEVAAKEYLFLLNFAMFEYTELWDGGSLAPEWSDLMRTQAGILANNPLGYALHNTYIAPVISKPSLATIRSIFQDGNTPAQDDPSLAGVSGYVVDPIRLETRWDGTEVPVESVARDWWGNSAQRSAAFASAGTVTVSSTYTRDRVHGSNTTHPTSASATHGTQCGSLIFGRNHGWAYNANKWHLNLYGNSSAGSIERGFDIQKIFHQNKPINPLYGTKDPTISSNSWGYRASKSSSFYYFQSATGTAYSGSGDEPEFIRYMGADGDSGRWKSEFYDNSLTQAGKELVESGVIFVAAAGNSGQTQVNPDDPNYDNHVSNGSSDGVYNTDGAQTFSSFGYTVTGTTNRRGFPQHIGKTEVQTFQGNATVKFPAINIGALDDAFATGSKERKVTYSDMGNAIDLYAPADGTLAATVGLYGTDVARFDDTYDGFTEIACRDTRFSGTSAACPVAAGFLATVVQYNRGWTYENLRNWIETNVEVQSSSDFYDDTRGSTAEGTEWSDRNRLQGGVARVAYLASYDVTTPYPTGFTTAKGALQFRNGINLRFKK